MTQSVGIAIPVRNGERFVAETLRSIQALRLPFHAIVQDGLSTDRTLEVVEHTVGGDPRFEVVSEGDEGQADALNRAWGRLAPHHPFLTWVNADDVLHPHGFSQALSRASATPRAAAVYGAYLVIDANGLVIEFVRRPPRLRRWKLLYVDSLVPGVATICRTECVMRTGPFDTSLHYAMDTDMFIRLSQHGSLIGVPQPTYSFRAHDRSKTLGTSADQSRREGFEVAARHRRLRGPTGRLATKAARAHYRLTKMTGAQLPVERYGDQAVHLQPRS